MEGYITAVRGFHDFDVNGTRVSTSAATRYGTIGGKALPEDGGLRGGRTTGTDVADHWRSTDISVNASEVLIHGDWNKKVEGFGVIDWVISTGPEPVFRADGYRIRITSATETKFAGGLNSLADVGTNTWVKYQGRRDKAGMLVATKAAFVSAKTWRRQRPHRNRRHRLMRDKSDRTLTAIFCRFTPK